MPRMSAESVASLYGCTLPMDTIPESDRASLVALHIERAQAEAREEDAGRWDARARAARADAAKLRQSGDRFRAIIAALGGKVSP